VDAHGKRWHDGIELRRDEINFDGNFRHCERSEAIQQALPQGRTGLLRRFAPRNDDLT
jgi:hypothetical protein